MYRLEDQLLNSFDEILSLFSKMLSLEDIPHHIFQYMQDCLQTKLHDYVTFYFGKRSNYYDDKYWRNFMSTCKSLHEVRKVTIYLKLNMKYSIKFIHDLDFRNEVLSRVKRPSRQIGLDLVNYKVTDYELLAGIDGVNCVDLSFSDIERVDMLGNVSYLLLSDCEKLHQVNGLLNVETLDLSANHLHSVPTFGSKLLYLDLSGCTLVRDVSMFVGIRTLKFRGCEQITDVSMLGSSYELDLTGCVEIRDVSALGSVKILSLARCSKVTDVQALSNVEELDLTELPLRSVSVLTGVKKLKLCRMPELDSLLGLEEVQQLDITGSLKISDVTPLKKVSSLVLGRSGGYFNRNETSVQDIGSLVQLRVLHVRGGSENLSGLKKLINLEEINFHSFSPSKATKLPVKLVTLHDYRRDFDLSCFDQATKLTFFQSYETIVNLSPMINLQSVTITAFRHLQSFHGTDSLRELMIFDCNDLAGFSLSSMPNLEVLFLENGSELKTIELSGPRLRSSTLSKCQNLKSVVVGSPITSLRILDCNPHMKLEVQANVEECVLVVARPSYKIKCTKGAKILNLIVDVDED